VERAYIDLRDLACPPGAGPTIPLRKALGRLRSIRFLAEPSGVSRPSRPIAAETAANVRKCRRKFLKTFTLTTPGRRTFSRPTTLHLPISPAMSRTLILRAPIKDLHQAYMGSNADFDRDSYIENSQNYHKIRDLL
jgi:hypothetical protein